MNYKQQAANEAIKLVKPNQVIGLGGGRTIAYLAQELAAQTELAKSVSLVTSSLETSKLLSGLNLKAADTSSLNSIDMYFDGCDQLDSELNAFKSGGGIHTDEKSLAAMAKRFILLCDADKYSDQLTTAYPLTIEIIPAAVAAVSLTLKEHFDVVNVVVRNNADHQPVFTQRDGVLLEARFTVLPALLLMNQIKLWPGVIDHSLFYRLATDAIICGPDGVKHLKAGLGRTTYPLAIK